MLFADILLELLKKNIFRIHYILVTLTIFVCRKSDIKNNSQINKFSPTYLTLIVILWPTYTKIFIGYS